MLSKTRADMGKVHAHIPNITMLYGTQQLNPVLQKVLFTHLKEINQLRAIAACVRSQTFLSVITIIFGKKNQPMMNLTFGNPAQMRGTVATKRSMPLRYVSRERKTIVTAILCWSDSRDASERGPYQVRRTAAPKTVRTALRRARSG